MPDDLLKKARFHWIVKSRETIKLATVARDLHVDGHVELELEGNKLNRFVIGSRKTNKVHCVAQGLLFFFLDRTAKRSEMIHGIYLYLRLTTLLDIFSLVLNDSPSVD